MQARQSPDKQTTAGRLQRRSLAGMLGAATLALALPRLGRADVGKPILIQFSHVVTADTAKGRAALRFKELAEARTAGRVRVEVFPNSTLYKDREEMEALRLGAVQMLAPSLPKLAKAGGGDFEAFDLPFLFKDQAAFHAAAASRHVSELLGQLEPGGIKGLALWDNGFKVFTANRPLRVVADFKGLKIRIQASRTSARQMLELGATPSVTTLVDVYQALKDGRLDGQENTPSNIYSQRLHEVQSHLTVSNHGYLAYAVVVNKIFWDRLPAGIRTTLEGAMRDATVFANSIAAAENAKALERIRASGRLTVYTPSAAELLPWRTSMLPVYQASAQWIRPTTLSAMRLASGGPP